MWKSELTDREIADYVVETAGDDVDWGFVFDIFRDARATLRMVDVSSLVDGYADANSPSLSKFRRYMKMSVDSMPPLLIEGNEVRDGHHRLRVLRARGVLETLAYVVVHED